MRVEDLPGRAVSLCGAGVAGRSLSQPPCPSAEALNASAARLASDSVNHEHTKHTAEGLTWRDLFDLDPASAGLAATAAKRYGYAVDENALAQAEEALLGGRGGTETKRVVNDARREPVKERCWFRDKDARWTCALVTATEGSVGGASGPSPTPRPHLHQDPGPAFRRHETSKSRKYPASRFNRPPASRLSESRETPGEDSPWGNLRQSGVRGSGGSLA